MSTTTTRHAYLLASKKKLRGSMRSTLKSMSQNEIQDQSGLVTRYITALPAFQKAQTVSCYLSMASGELDTSVIVRSILQSGKTLFVPRIDRDRGEMDMLKIFDENDLSHLPSGTWGIKEPDLVKDGLHRPNVMDPGSPKLDLVLLPGLAFDSTLSRLGHGKGYYDRFLTSYQGLVAQRSENGKDTVNMPVLLGLALNPQLLDSSGDPVPIGDHDWKVDGVIFPGGFVGGPENVDTL